MSDPEFIERWKCWGWNAWWVKRPYKSKHLKKAMKPKHEITDCLKTVIHHLELQAYCLECHDTSNSYAKAVRLRKLAEELKWLFVCSGGTWGQEFNKAGRESSTEGK